MSTRTWGGRRRAVGGAAVLALVMVVLGACIVRTELIASGFNGGMVDSPDDPSRDPHERKTGIVVALMREELMDAYFGQGELAQSERRSSHGRRNVWQALEWAAQFGTERFVEYAKCYALQTDPATCQAFAPGGGARSAAHDDGGARGEARDGGAWATQAPVPMPWAESAVRLAGRAGGITDSWFGRRRHRPICTKELRLDVGALGAFVDQVRFDLALARAADAVGKIWREGLVDREAVRDGAEQAFTEAALYLKKRKWRRRVDQRTLGLVVKGGAATGIYSAGAVWAILHLIDECTKDPAGCGLPGDRKVDLDFRLLSGTSTGAMVSAAVDRFSCPYRGGHCSGDLRRDRIEDIAQWFTCYSLNDLYCVDSRPVFSLAERDEQLGVLRFDGIRDILDRCVNDEMLANRSELLLSITEFRSGRLLHLSDQGELKDEHDVVRAAVASAALPFFVWPEQGVPMHVDDTPEPTGAFLDGGIRSEIPLLALAKRGAERVVVVSSSPSVLGDTKQLRTGLAVGLRYVDVSTGGVTESELAHAQSHVESIRYAEYLACRRALASAGLCGEGCDAEAVCEGRWQEVCGADKGPGEGCEVPDRRPPAEHIRALWQVERIFRNASQIGAAQGYDFKPRELRRLFRAGAEAARQRCIQIAGLLGIPGPGKLTPEVERTLMAHCAPRLAPRSELCEGSSQLDEDERLELRDCGGPVPQRCTQVCDGASVPADCPPPAATEK